jgi:hypothetical protein
MLVQKLEPVMSDSPASESRKQPAPSPPTPSQRRLGTRLAIGIIVAALLAIILLDHYGILH